MKPRRLTRTESAEVTRRGLLQAAKKVFLQRGFHGASLEAVASEAGFTTGAVYSRFESKADLFLAVLDERYRETLASVAEAGARAQTRAGVTAAAAGWWPRRLREGPDWTLVLVEFWAFAGRDPSLRKRFSAQHERLLEGVANVIDARLTELSGEPGDGTLDFIRTTTALAHGLALEELVSPEAVSEELVEGAFGLFRRALEGGRSTPARRVAMKES
ncbi:MAG TPA: TetR/AcrR family transcriptional regulator [Anaeromyxobacteraceae bacterium]|nr:TetR/AcrR family transcriptional regulator [Anaeromyxobacteraceae bacterium]